MNISKPSSSFGTAVYLASLLSIAATILPRSVAAQQQTTIQPSLALTYGIDENAFVHIFAGNFTPSGWGATNGQLVNVASNLTLFSRIGTTFGGDGVNNFALPDLSGRVALGSGAALGLTPTVPGDTGGTKTVTLTNTQLPTGMGGQDQPFTNLEPYLSLHYVIATQGIYPSPNAGASPTFLGQVALYAGAVAPAGWVFADGSLRPINQNQALFSLLGTTFGGNGTTQFALPDLRDRVPVGAGSVLGLTPRDPGEKFGTESTTLTNADIPVTLGGAGQPYSNMQPSLGINFLIAETGIYPSRDPGPIYSFPNEAVLGELFMFSGVFAPHGMPFADGSILPINQNTALFSLLGTQFGGNGVTNFGLPDLRGRDVIGAGNSLTPNGLTPYVVGQTDGVEFLSLTADGPLTPPTSAVPEPATYLSISLFGLALIARRVLLVK